ncbi:MAG: hypothetical protein J6Q38_03490, partial [Clostridia bacterium]|nr:hypothetical protein [Clostridia bacterium]
MSNGVKGKEKDNKFFTIEFFGVTLIIFSFLLLVCLLFGSSVLFELGEEIKFSLLGAFGYFAYPFLLSLNVVGFMMLLGKKPSKASVLSTLKYSFTLVLILCLFTVITNLKNPSNFNEYVSYAYASGRLGLNGVVAGGALFSALTFLAIQNLTFVGSIIFFSLVLLVDLVVIFKSAKKKKAIVSDVTEKTTQPIEQERTANLNAQPQNYAVPPQFNGNSYGAPNGYDNGYQPPFGNNPYNQPQGFNQAGYNGQNSFNTQSGYDSRQGFGHYGGFSVPQNNEQQSSNAPSREEAMRILYGNPRVYSEEYNNNFSTPRVNLTGENGNQSSFNNQGMVSNPISKEEINPSFTFEDKSNIKIYEEEPIDSFDNLEIEENLADKYKPESTFEYKSFFKDSLKESSERSVPLVNDDFADEEISLNTNDLVDGDPITKPFINEPINTTPSASTPIFKAASQDENTKTQSATIGEQYTKFLIENMPLNYKYTPPPQRLLKTSSNSDVDYQFEIFKAEIKNKILETLDNFGIKTQVARVFRGPAVTRFDVEVPATVPMSNITKRQGDINLRIAATSPIRMIAPVPGTPYVGIEVANNKRDVVTLKDIVSSDGFMNAEEHSITFALGKDVIGTPISLDVTKMPHLLIAGAT